MARNHTADENQTTVFNRARINKILGDAVKHQLTVVAATAGYGKTTAVRCFIAGSGLPCAWVSVTSGSELALWDKICASTARFSAKAAAALSEISLPSSDVQAAKVLSLIADCVKRDFVLVIDDYHLLPEDNRINDLIRSVVREETSNLHIVIISRSVPNLRVTTLVSKGLCSLITTDDLAFTNEETDGYLGQRGLRLSRSAVSKIRDGSAGWISAIFLMSEGVRNGLAIGEAADINKLLEENFIDSLDEDARSMLIRLSALDCFTEKQAVYVLHDKKAAAVLREMTRLNAFTSRDESETYRFHNILRSCLERKLVRAEFVTVCRRSASWLKRSGDTEGALGTLLRAGDARSVLKELNTPRHPFRRFASGDRAGRIFAATDNERACVEYPFPYLHMIFFSFISGIRTQAALSGKLLSIMEEHFANAADRKGRTILGECCVLRFFSNIRVDGKSKYLKQAAEFFGDERSELLFRDDAFTFGIPSHLYGCYHIPGTLDLTAKNSAETSFELISDGFGHGKDKLIYAETAVERCDFETARLRAEQTLIKAAAAHQSHIAAAALFTLIRADLYDGSFSAAREKADRINKLPEEFRCRFDSFDRASYAALAESVFGYMYACAGVPEKIPLPLKKQRELGGMMLNGFGFFALIRAKAALLADEFGEAEAIAEDCERQLESSASQLGRINARTVLAAAKYGLGEREAAVKILSEILGEAELDGVILPFAENAPHIIPILEAITARGRRSFASKVLNACREYTANVARRKPKTNADLSKRETETLRLAALGKTQKEIAAHLNIEPVTAKKHLISAYKKLGADNKISAVKSAESLGLL